MVLGGVTGAEEYGPRVHYKVRKGDTLETISKATGIPVSVLAKDNKLKDPNRIAVGQNLVLQYHPASWERINGSEMNEMFPNPADQEAYFEQMDAATEAKYNAIAKDGAQKHINTKW